MAYVGSALTQSKFYSPAFNAAIFDGPVRIYFAQHQEPLALKVYFHLQERLRPLFDALEGGAQAITPHVFVMLYPTKDSFQLSFSNDAPSEVLGEATMNLESQSILDECLDDDFVVGVCPVEGQGYESLYDRVESIVRGVLPATPQAMPAQAL